MKTPKCYTWLESCGSHLSGGVKEKIFFCILQSVRFSMTVRTDIFLYTEKLSSIQIFASIFAGELVCCICICIFCICWWAQDVSKGNPGFGFGAHSLVLPEPKMGQVCPQQRTLHHLLFYFRSVFWYSETLLWFLDEVASPAPSPHYITDTNTFLIWMILCPNFLKL